jgi:hypothetical protein
MSFRREVASPKRLQMQHISFKPAILWRVLREEIKVDKIWPISATTPLTSTRRNRTGFRALWRRSLAVSNHRSTTPRGGFTKSTRRLKIRALSDLAHFTTAVSVTNQRERYPKLEVPQGFDFRHAFMLLKQPFTGHCRTRYIPAGCRCQPCKH